MPVLISGGDSFTWGSELPDQYLDHEKNIPSQMVWSANIARHYNMDYICAAKPGCANNSIVRRVIKEIVANAGEEIYVAVMWTFTHRSETKLKNVHNIDIAQDPIIAARYGIDDGWINFNSWHGLSFEEKMSYFPQDVEPERYEFFCAQHQKMTDIGLTDAGDKFYKITGDHIYHNYNTLKDICLLQYYCESRHIPYFFCSASDDLLKSQDTALLDYGLYDAVNWDAWYCEAAFHPWAKDYPQCGNHPGIEAHVDWFNLILPKISACFTQNNT